jgi:hypothetical protein
LLPTGKEPTILDFFGAAGEEDVRCHIFSGMVKCHELFEIMMLKKSDILKQTCKRGHEKLTKMVINELSMSASDIEGTTG